MLYVLISKAVARLACAVALIGIIIPQAALCESENESEKLPLEMQKTRPMHFPKIVINEVSQNGMICVANGAKNPSNSLCPNKKGKSFKLKVTGSPNALITVHNDSPPTEDNGFQFSIIGTPINTTLNANGKKHVELSGNLKLINKPSVKSGRMSFSYDISVVYQ